MAYAGAVDSLDMSNDITLSEVQEFIAGFWYHYDQGHFDEDRFCLRPATDITDTRCIQLSHATDI